MITRSPVVFWVLLAATVAVDAVAFYWVRSLPGPTLALVAFDALLVSQLSVGCIWSALAARRTSGAILVPLLMLAVAGFAMSRLERAWDNLLPYYGLHIALLWIGMKLLERTQFWRRRSHRSASWQYSVVQLLMAMTVVAVLSAAVSRSQLFDQSAGGAGLNAAFIAGSLALTLAALIGWSLSIHWLQRLAGALGCAVVLGGAFALFVESQFSLYFGFHYLIQAVVLSIWFGCGPIIPRGELPDTGRSSTAAEPDPRA